VKTAETIADASEAKREHAGGNPSVGFDSGNHPEPFVDFPYDEIDGCEPAPDLDFVGGIVRIVRWINAGHGATARAIRSIAVEFHFSGKTQAELGRESGITKAAVCRAANEFRDHFGLDELLVEAPRMRTNQTREKFSKQCKTRHKKKSRSSTKSPSKSLSTTGTLYDLVRRQSPTGPQQ